MVDWAKAASSFAANASDLAWNTAGSAISYGFGRKAANDQWDRQKDAWVKGPSYQVMGLRRAGLNPILAAKGGLGGGGFSPSAVASGGQGGFSGTQARANRIKDKLADAQIADLAASVNAKNAAARASDAQADFTRANVPSIQSNIDKNAQFIRESREKIKKLAADIDLTRAQTLRADLAAEKLHLEMVSERVMSNLWSTLDPETQTNWTAVFSAAATAGLAVALGPTGSIGRAVFGRVWKAAGPTARKWIIRKLKQSSKNSRVTESTIERMLRESKTTKPRHPLGKIPPKKEIPVVFGKDSNGS